MVRGFHHVERGLSVKGSPKPESARRADDGIACGKGVQISAGGARAGKNRRAGFFGKIVQVFVGANDKGNALSGPESERLPHPCDVALDREKIPPAEPFRVVPPPHMHPDDTPGHASGIVHAAVHLCPEFRNRGKKIANRSGMIAQGIVEYVEFPEALKGKYQSFTQADISALRAAGYKDEFYDVASGVASYVKRLAK